MEWRDTDQIVPVVNTDHRATTMVLEPIMNFEQKTNHGNTATGVIGCAAASRSRVGGNPYGHHRDPAVGGSFPPTRE
jgi:hypothetical protein